MAVEPPYRMKNMMPGMIMLWYGSIETIPSGWHICDGNMGTPNLLRKFVRGAGVGAAPGDIAGVTAHNHGFAGDGHLHHLVEGTDITSPTPPTEFGYGTTISVTTGITDNGTNLPPYMFLCYIMKL